MAVLLRGVPTQFEPTLKNRFEIQFPQELDIPSYLVQTSGRPKVDIEQVEIPYMNTSSWTTSKYKWGQVAIKFIDLIGPSTSQKLMEWERLHYESLTGRGGYAAGYKKDIIINTLDPTGVTISVWKMYECQLVSLEFDENDHGAGELIMPSITIQPYYCELSY
jgi:hypothetical protein